MFEKITSPTRGNQYFDCGIFILIQCEQFHTDRSIIRPSEMIKLNVYRWYVTNARKNSPSISIKLFLRKETRGWGQDCSEDVADSFENRTRPYFVAVFLEVLFRWFQLLCRWLSWTSSRWCVCSFDEVLHFTHPASISRGVGNIRSRHPWHHGYPLRKWRISYSWVGYVE